MKLIKLNNFLKKIFLLIFFYLIISYFIYLVSAIFFTQGKILDYKVLLNYQRNFYNQLGYRNIWQTQENCVEFDEHLIFKPSSGKCLFKNPEFNTELNFSNEGRNNKNFIDSKNLINEKNIAVIGDSFAMGWGVNDNQTFSSLIEKQTKKKVYNMAVSGYATERALIRLQKSGLLDKVDTIIIQYCGNDITENSNHKNKTQNYTKEKYNIIFNEKLSFWAKLRKSIRYSLIIPFEVLSFKENSLTWFDHEFLFEEILHKYEFINQKRVIVFAVNGPQLNFYDFPNLKSKNFNELYYLNINFEKKDFFLVDGHLNDIGHKKIANEIVSFLSKNPN